MAVVKLLAVFIGLVGMANGLWLVQLNAGVVTSHGGDRSPSLDAAKDAVMVWPERALGAFNDTIDKLTEITGTINNTASDMMSTFTDSTGEFAAVLGTLQQAATAAAMLSPEINEKATKFIDFANSTLQKATEKLPVVYATVQSELVKNVETIKRIAFDLSNDLFSAAKEVLALSNLTDSSALIKRLVIARLGNAATQTKEKLSSSPVRKRHLGKALTETIQKVNKHTIKRARNTMVMKHLGGKKAVALMEERALRGEEMALNQVDHSVARKKGSSLCVTALKSISAANFTLSAIGARIQAINGTASDLLVTYLDAFTSALSMINGSVAPVAVSALPSNMLSPVTSGLDNLLSVGDTLMSTFQVSWEIISPFEACEWNNESIQRSSEGGHGYTLDSCKDACSGSCQAIDFYTETGWCNFYDVPCDTPQKEVDGATSYRKQGLFNRIEGMITDAVSILEPVGSLVEALVDGVTQAQCDGACGATEKAACQAAAE